MSKSLRIAMAQMDFLVGDVYGNAEKIIRTAESARDEHHAQVVAFPELALTGYPPEDLLLRGGLARRVVEAMEVLRRKINGITAIIGHPHWEGGERHNSASVIRDGKVLALYHKQHLPNYGVFDERRYFVPGSKPCVVDLEGVPVGITICEDAWYPGPVSRAVKAGAKLVVNINASPYHMNKGRERIELIADLARTNQVPVIYVNLVGGQDELVFDGNSFVVNAAGDLTQCTEAFVEGLFPVEIRPGEKPEPAPAAVAALLSEEESVYCALVLAVRDYIGKNNFAGAVVGLSGGIDSVLTLAIAVDAIGKERLHAVMMPSRFTSTVSLEDAAAVAGGLGVKFSTIPIEPMYEAFLTALADEFRGLARDTTEENLQARIRGMLLMAISNKTGKLVLTTGNKSEMAVGYATLYGDMAGGYAVIKDVPKTLVYRLAEYRNRVDAVIPRRVFERAPSAELAPDQKDTDTLPPYQVLDPILERYVERDECPEEIIEAGFDSDTVYRVVAMVDRNEYKRRQAPPGVRITPRAFGRDRRYPITSGYGRRKPAGFSGAN